MKLRVVKDLQSGARGQSEVTLGQLAERKLTALCRELGLEPEQERSARHALRTLCASVLDRRITDEPPWDSDITDDGSPFEVSVELDGDRVNVRLLAEAWDDSMRASNGWAPALELTRALADEPGVDLSRFEALHDLFIPDPRVEARFGLWHAAVVPAEGPPLYKVYFNPQILGPSLAPGLIREMLERIEIPGAWAAVQELLAVAAGRNELLYVALDLRAGERARVKVYVAHHDVHATALERQLSRFSRYEPGYATWLVQQLSGRDGSFDQRPVLTCLSFSEGADEPEVTLHFPARCYVESDARLVERLVGALGRSRGERLERAIQAYGERDLSAGRGLITYVSMRKPSEGSAPRVVAYLSPEAYAVAEPTRAGRRRRSSLELSLDRDEPAPMARVLERVEGHRVMLEGHPFIEHMESSSELGDAAIIAEGLGFFVLVFQDVLRIAAQCISDPRLMAIAQQHYREDSGHDRWYLADAARLGVTVTERSLFSSAQRLPRDVSYQLVAEVLRARDDASRLAVVFALEAVGEVFFERIIGLLDRAGASSGMQYFGRHHQEVEQGHAMFESDVQSQLAAIDLSVEARARVEATVGRVFLQMEHLSDHIHERLQAFQVAVAES